MGLAYGSLLVDNTFLQLISLIVSLSNQIAALQQENIALRGQLNKPTDLAPE